MDFLEIRSTLGRLFCNYLSETFHCDEAAAVKENIDILAWKNIQRMLDECDYRGVAFLAAWIRENRNGHTGFMVEDDEPYFYPLDEDGNYVEGAFGRCC